MWAREEALAGYQLLQLKLFEEMPVTVGLKRKRKGQTYYTINSDNKTKTGVKPESKSDMCKSKCTEKQGKAQNFKLSILQNCFWGFRCSF